MDPNHPYFLDGLNMLNDDLDLSGPAETVAGPSGSGATLTSRTKSKRLTSDVWQCFDVVEMTLPDGTVGPRAKCFYNMKLAESGCPPAQSLTLDDWEDDMLGPTVVAMETKFKKYWSEMPFLYALGVIVDLRIKLAGLEYLLDFIGNKLSVDYSDQITDIRNKLFEVFSIYEPRFLEAQFDADENMENFDLLLWWKTYSYRYPVLSHLARDILVIPVSTVSSEQTFSKSGRIIEPRRSCLTPEMVEVLLYVRDWEHARKRMQNETVDEQFIQNFSNLYVDEGSGSNQV
ncbi:hypothetical protein Dsin_005212 [Dipteronia sinensis]|uniref:HAT C-terminal dimerisation domain-containing protein n=1 Tax=Dipteronia sinensis TaxID=43782 RepID=A0AAE0AWY9_9ROSI|nr:hypothetical protein Dsin_005212 [Dipteronia sinensis]